MARRGQKFDEGKPRWDLLLVSLGTEVAEVVDILTFGAQKYKEDNWQKVPKGKARYLAAAMRHIMARIRGERLDKESGKHHMAHAVCCLLFWMWIDNQEILELEKL